MPFMLNKFGAALRAFGSKASVATSWLGHKVGNALTAAAPVVSAISPTLGAGVASAGLVAKGVGTLGDWGRLSLASGNMNFQSLRGIGGQIRNDAAAVRSAYSDGRAGVRSALERGKG
jgi:hypothetical protein